MNDPRNCGGSVISGELVALADALAHGGYIASTIFFRCELCKSVSFYVVSSREEYDLQMEDLLINKLFTLKCAECGAIEGDLVTTVIPSWIWHPMREKIREQQEASEIDWL